MSNKSQRVLALILLSFGLVTIFVIDPMISNQEVCFRYPGEFKNSFKLVCHEIDPIAHPIIVLILITAALGWYLSSKITLNLNDDTIIDNES